METVFVLKCYNPFKTCLVSYSKVHNMKNYQIFCSMHDTLGLTSCSRGPEDHHCLIQIKRLSLLFMVTIFNAISIAVVDVTVVEAVAIGADVIVGDIIIANSFDSCSCHL